MAEQLLLLNTPVYVSEDFYSFQNDYWLAGNIKTFDAKTGTGSMEWLYHRWVAGWSFNKMGKHSNFTETTAI